MTSTTRLTSNPTAVVCALVVCLSSALTGQVRRDGVNTQGAKPPVAAKDNSGAKPASGVKPSSAAEVKETAKAPAPKPEQSASGVILRAMKDELERSKTLAIGKLDQPYFIEYAVEDVQSFSVAATLGGLMSTSQNRFRVPRVQVRVGNYDFDNTNYIFSDYYAGTRYDSNQLALDDDYAVLRRSFWLATDRAYKTAVEAIARKRAALKNVTQNVTLADMWKAEPVVKIVGGDNPMRDTDRWTERVHRLSRIFNNYPEVLVSSVSFDGQSSVFYLHNSEGTTVRQPESMFSLNVRASAQAKDGANIRDAVMFTRPSIESMPSEQEIEKAAREMAENVKSLTAAPNGETYSGPVLVEGIAAPQMIAEVLSPHLGLTRRPVGEPGRPVSFVPSDLEGRIGSRIFPEFITIKDDPLRKEWSGVPLLGHFEIDEQGVAPTPVTVIDKGRLAGYLLTRQPMKGYEASNGRARIPGSYGSRRAAITNLFVESSESYDAAELKKRLLQMVQDRSKPYGIIIRKMDFPTTASVDELRRVVMGGSQSGARPISSPVLVYRVYPDGREELVRGLRFRGVNVRSFRDVLAVSKESFALHYMNNLAPFNAPGTGYVAPASVIAPSMLFDDLELERPQDDIPNPPLVPAPPLSASR